MEPGSWELLCPFLEEPGWAAIAVPAAGLAPGFCGLQGEQGSLLRQGEDMLDQVSPLTCCPTARPGAGAGGRTAGKPPLPECSPGGLPPPRSSLSRFLSFRILSPLLGSLVPSWQRVLPVNQIHWAWIEFRFLDFLGSRQLCPVVLARPWGAEQELTCQTVCPGAGSIWPAPQACARPGAFHRYPSLSM